MAPHIFIITNRQIQTRHASAHQLATNKATKRATDQQFINMVIIIKNIATKSIATIKQETVVRDIIILVGKNASR